jgi:activator of 2-hydroxyglutaryl-CoA dehydratase/predicted nucleotide-binding protein (sugar kinase/HSP70/actin superfamily)
MTGCLPSNSTPHRPIPRARPQRYLGIDVGAETIKLAELIQDGTSRAWGRCEIVEHHKKPGPALLRLLREWDWGTLAAAAVCGRLSRQIRLPRVPVQQVQTRACRFLAGPEPATVVSIGSHGFSVLELRANGIEVFRENNRCSQGTGNFLRQLTERFSLTIEEASELAAAVESAAPLSGRCPVILKSDMTHLANKGEDRARILAGLFDAVCENVLVLLKPGLSPGRVLLTGGVSRSRRVRKTVEEFLARHEMKLVPLEDDSALFFEARGCALIAAERGAAQLPSLDNLIRPRSEVPLERLPPLSASLAKVHRLPRRPPAPPERQRGALILGLDIGSTGSKAVAIDTGSSDVRWEDYRGTLGDPVGAAQELVGRFCASPLADQPVLAVGVTGSGREIVSSLLTTCYGKDAVFVLNEIAAHAAGAVHFDPRVDTIFEIGGQDAKYARLADGRVVDCAMNEACSAGTGSFIEEQGRKFAGIRDVVQLGEEALAAREGVSLGQHCSVFMAEVIDEAVAAGVDQRTIIAGLYDSIIQNYLYRVKGNRTVGKVIFCQGMPFSSDALAAAVARQTASDVIIPPNPGTVGALGIALLTHREVPWADRPALELTRFLTARVGAKDTFICKATSGCGAGNRCRIERLQTLVGAHRQIFTWGGGCALHDKGTRKKKLPDLAPDPFREREELIQRLIADLASSRQPESTTARHTVALSDEFMLKGLFPFFATFLHELGLDLRVAGGCDSAALKRGIQECNVPFCAPMQQFHGLVSRMAETDADHLFLPMIRSLPRVNGEPYAVTCPIAQAGPDLLRWDLNGSLADRVLSPVIDVGEGNLDSMEFLAGCQTLAQQLGRTSHDWKQAHRRAAAAQARFEKECAGIGRRALAFCAAHNIVPVVMLGRPYTIYNTVLNSNVPAILREQGAIGIPVDCYPVDERVPSFKDMYWSHGQRILRAAHQIRRTPGVYSLYCSNYSCGPDSFNLHFYAHIMEGKPFVIIETDGHSGDAGTKTRVEAFLHCVAQDLHAAADTKAPHDFSTIEKRPASVAEIRRRGETLLIPWIGPGSPAFAACLHGAGLLTECLPMPDAESLRLGRRCTSGKECLPLCLTLGNLLKRLERERDTDRRFALLMTTTNGPCREGTYNLLNQITIERLGWKDRVRIWSPVDTGYFDDMPGGLSALVFATMMASDLLLGALHDVRPVEARAGAAQDIYDRHFARLLQRVEMAAAGDLSLPAALWQVATGRLFGLSRMLAEASADFAGVRTPKPPPTVLVVGEVYVRGEAFANNFLIDKLEARGLRTRLAPLCEWIEYSDLINRREATAFRLGDRVSSAVQQRIQDLTYRVVARPLGWPPRPRVGPVLEAVEPYLRTDLFGEAVLTVGGPLEEWRHGRIDAVVSVGPLECMPNKIAEAQLFHVAEREGLLALTLPVNGDSLDDEVLDNFAFEVHKRFRQKQRSTAGTPSAVPIRRKLRFRQGSASRTSVAVLPEIQ